MAKKRNTSLAPTRKWDRLVKNIAEKKARGDELTPFELQVECTNYEKEILDYLAAGKTIEEVAYTMNMPAHTVEALRDSGTQKALATYTGLSPHATFLQYAAFHMRLIRRLDEACDRFMAADSTQYNALVGALKAESEIYDKVFAKGIEFGVISKRKVRKEAKMKDKDLLKALQAERAKIDDLIGELEVSVEKRKITMRVSSRKQGVTDRDTELKMTQNGESKITQGDILAKILEEGIQERETLEINSGEKDHKVSG